MNAPRNAGMAQKVQRRSQPDAIFSGATTLPPSRRRSTRGPEAGATPSGRSGMAAVPCPGSAAPGVAGRVGRRDRQQLAPVAGLVRLPALAVGDRVEPGRDVTVVIEAEDLRFGQRLGQARAVTLGQAARGHHLGPTGRRTEQLIDGFLFGSLDEPAGVDQHDVGRAVLRDGPAAGVQPCGELLGVDFITGAAQRNQADGAPRPACASLT